MVVLVTIKLGFNDSNEGEFTAIQKVLEVVVINNEQVGDDELEVVDSNLKQAILRMDHKQVGSFHRVVDNSLHIKNNHNLSKVEAFHISLKAVEYILHSYHCLDFHSNRHRYHAITGDVIHLLLDHLLFFELH